MEDDKKGTPCWYNNGTWHDANGDAVKKPWY
jgi:hypothetical protein